MESRRQAQRALEQGRQAREWLDEHLGQSFRVPGNLFRADVLDPVYGRCRHFMFGPYTFIGYARSGEAVVVKTSPANGERRTWLVWPTELWFHRPWVTWSPESAAA